MPMLNDSVIDNLRARIEDQDAKLKRPVQPAQPPPSPTLSPSASDLLAHFETSAKVGHKDSSGFPQVCILTNDQLARELGWTASRTTRALCELKAAGKTRHVVRSHHTRYGITNSNDRHWPERCRTVYLTYIP